MPDFPKMNLAKMMKKVAEIAKKDGKITDEEYELLEGISFDVAEYMIALEKSMEDGVIDEQEAVLMQQLKNKIINNAKKVASQDGHIDEDEAQILKELIYILEN